MLAVGRVSTSSVLTGDPNPTVAATEIAAGVVGGVRLWGFISVVKQ